jgi:hypothetical protein
MAASASLRRDDRERRPESALTSSCFSKSGQVIRQHLVENGMSHKGDNPANTLPNSVTHRDIYRLPATLFHEREIVWITIASNDSNGVLDAK